MVVSMVEQTLVVGEMRSGRRIVALPASDCTWSVAAGAAGSIDATVPLTATDFQRVVHDPTSGRWAPSGRSRREIDGATEPVRMFAAVLAGDHVIEAGPIWDREWDQGAGTLRLRATGIAALFDYRLLLSHLVSWQQAGAIAASSLSWSGLSLGTIAKRMVQATLAHTDGDLPIVLPPDQSGSNSRTYPGYELATVGQRLSELSGVDGGPEIAFEPRLTTDRMGIEWVMRVGTTAQPTLQQAGLDWVLDTSAPAGGVTGFTVAESASDMTLRAFAKGSGTDKATLISRPATRTDLLAAGYPLLDSVHTYSSVKQQGTVDAHARGDLASNDRPWVTWTLTIPADDRLGQYRPGDWWQIRVGDDHVYLDPGAYRARLASMKGGLGASTVDLAMAPMEVT